MKKDIIDDNFDQCISMDRAIAIIAEQLSRQDCKYFLLEQFVIALGYNCAAFIGYLLNKHFYYTRTGELVNHKTRGDGWFYFTINCCEEQLHLSREEQDSCIRKLKKYDLIEVVTMGSPPKRYFRLNLCKIANIFLDKKIEGNMRVSLKLKCGKPTIRSAENTQLLHIYNKSKDMKEDKKEEYIAPPFGDAKKISSSSFSSSSPHSSEQEKLVRQPQVEVTNDEHKKLIEKFGEDFVKEGYIELSDWKNSASPHQVKKHKSDYYRLRKWVIPGLIDQNSKLNESKIAKHRRGSPLVTPGDYDEDNFRRVRI